MDHLPTVQEREIVDLPRDNGRSATELVALRREIDDLVAQLERMNLEGRRRVPANWEPALAGIREQLNEAPEAIRHELRSRVSTSRLMDGLYEAQWFIQRQRLGPMDEDDPPDEAMELRGGAQTQLRESPQQT